MIGDRELQEVTRNAFMTQDRARVFDRRADVEVLAGRVVRRNEVKAAVVFIVNAGRIHETTGTGRLERFRQLSNLERANVRGNRHQPAVL